MGLYDSTHAVRNEAGDKASAYSVAAADGAIAAKSGVVVITKGLAAALTLAAPVAGDPASGGDNGKKLTIVSGTAFAHTVTNAAPGFNNGGALADVATFAAAIGNCLELVAYNGVWHTTNLKGVTLA